jgi:YD repeat-containing protein
LLLLFGQSFRRVVSLAFFAASLLLFVSAIQLKPASGARILGASQPIGAEAPGTCSHTDCACPCSCGAGAAPGAPCSAGYGGISISYSEGNLKEHYHVVDLKSSLGATLRFSLIYDSYNADGSRTQLDTGMGFGWTNSYNILLFSQNGNMFRMDGQGRVTKYLSQGGGFFVSAAGYFETLTGNMNGTFTLRQKDATTFLFAQIPNTPFLILGQSPFRLTRITDRNNNVTTVSYDANGNLAQVTDTYGRSVTLGYDSQHHLRSIGDPLGRVTTLAYDPADTKLQQISDPAGKFTAFTYDANYHLIRDLDRDHRVFVNGYSQGEPVSITPISPVANPPPSPITFMFDLNNPVNWATDPQQLQQNQLRVYIPSTTTKQDGQGEPWQYSYDSNGYVTRTMAPDGATTSSSYDPMTLLPAATTDADGNTTSFQYDSMGNLLQRTDATPFGFATTYTYEPSFNQMTSMTDPNMRATTYQIDPADGNRLSATDPLGGIERWTYDAHGNVVSDTDKNGHTTTYMYDAFGNRVQTIDPLGNVTTMTYDAAGNVLSRTDANMHTTHYSYDALDSLIQETDPLSNTNAYSYNGKGNRVRVTDRDGNTTQYQYDLRSRLIKVTDALGQTTRTTYDGNDNVILVTDKNGHPTTFIYDAQNRRVQTTDALGDTSTMTYDPFGNVTSQTDANGNTTTYTYDQLNRETSHTDAVGSVTSTFYDMTGPNTGPCMNVCTGPTKGSSLPSKVIDGDASTSG